MDLSLTRDRRNLADSRCHGSYLITSWAGEPANPISRVSWIGPSEAFLHHGRHVPSHLAMHPAVWNCGERWCGMQVRERPIPIAGGHRAEQRQDVLCQRNVPGLRDSDGRLQRPLYRGTSHR